MSDAKKDGRETDRRGRGGNDDPIGSSRVEKSSHGGNGLPNIRIDTKGGAPPLPHLLSTTSMDIPDGKLSIASNSHPNSLSSLILFILILILVLLYKYRCINTNHRSKRRRCAHNRWWS
jgi:hypothetical protein